MKRDRSRKSLLSHERTVTDGDGHFPEGNSPSGSLELIQLHQLVAHLQFIQITNQLMLQPDNLTGKIQTIDYGLRHTMIVILFVLTLMSA